MTLSWPTERVLVTGAGGFLGAALARILEDRGAAVIGLDLASSSPCWQVWGHTRPMWHGTVLNPDAILTAVRDARPTVLFHLAGFSHILPAQRTPLVAWDLNVRGTYHTLDACRRYRDWGGDLRAIVVSSSNHIYGGSRVSPWREVDLPRPTDVYGTSKFCQDLIAQTYALSLGVPAIPLRHVNVYGPGDPHRSHLITGAVLAALRGEPFVMRNPSATKGYLYLDDALAAYLRCAELAASGLTGPQNAGASPISVTALVHLVAAITGGPAPILDPDLFDAGQTLYFEALSSRRLESNGWLPSVTLNDGIKRTYDWYREHAGWLP